LLTWLRSLAYIHRTAATMTFVFSREKGLVRLVAVRLVVVRLVVVRLVVVRLVVVRFVVVRLVAVRLVE